MPFQPMNYASIPTQGSPWLKDFVNNLATGYQASQLPGQLARQKQKEQLLNAFQGLRNQEEPQRFQSEMSSESLSRALQQANVNRLNTMTPLEAEKLKLANQFYPDLTRAQIESSKALSDMRQFGGSGVGAGGKEELLFQNLVSRDNPNLTPEQVYEASNALRQGKETLTDGTKINPLSPAAQGSLNRLTKYGTTAPLITGNIQGAQAESEIDALAKYAQEGLKPYGTTYVGMNPNQILDTFKNDAKSQKRLGEFIASQQLQYEIAQNQIRLANGKPGINATQELMDLGMQHIAGSYPRLTQQARQAAQNYFIEGLKKGFEARKKVNLGASNASSQGNTSQQNANQSRVFNLETGDFE